jgi:hypothetical protein
MHSICLYTVYFLLNLLRLIFIPTGGLLNLILAELLRRDRCRFFFWIWRVRMSEGKLQHNCLFRGL